MKCKDCIHYEGVNLCDVLFISNEPEAEHECKDYEQK